MQISHIAGYKFITLNDLSALQSSFTQCCQTLALKGTILLSKEGINISLAGAPLSIAAFKRELLSDTRFSDVTFRESHSRIPPFKRLKVKVKDEIITMRRPEVQPEKRRAASLSPEEWKQWLDEGRDVTILDTRNDYEVKFGAFRQAAHLHLNDFCEFAEAAQHLPKQKPVLMYCTGGIRCEKAGVHLLSQGFSEVYQLEGGILNYFATVGGAHYDGECFVFDERIALDANLETTGTVQCHTCQGPVKPLTTCSTCHTFI